MAITPSLKAMESVSEIMARTVQSLHKFIEVEYNPNKSKEMMALMIGFATGLILQLRDKVELLEKGLGDEFLSAVNNMTTKGSRRLETLEKLNRNDPSLSESSSGVNPDDLPAAVDFLQSKLVDTIRTNMEALPLVLRSDVILTHALAMLVANLLSGIDAKNVNALIDTFSQNVRTLTTKSNKSNKSKEQQYYH